MKQQIVYVLAPDGSPFMPTTRSGKVRRMLKSGKAVTVTTKPFVIRLTYWPETRVVQEVALGNDLGRTNIAPRQSAGTGSASTPRTVQQGTGRSRN